MTVGNGESEDDEHHNNPHPLAKTITEASRRPKMTSLFVKSESSFYGKMTEERAKDEEIDEN